MFKKIATKSLVIFLAVLILVFSTITPAAKQISFASPVIPVGTNILDRGQSASYIYGEDVKDPLDKLSPDELYISDLGMETTLEGEEESTVLAQTNLCGPCFTMKPPVISLWKMLFTASLSDSLFSIIPRIILHITKWIVMLEAKMLMDIMAPKEGQFFARSGFAKYSVDSPFVTMLWEISKNYANLLIVLFLIWIAINIILGRKEYLNYQYLIRLLVIALLLNFSLVVCGLFVDISNYITYLFMSGFDGSGFSCLYTCVLHKVANIFDCAAYNMWFPQTISHTLGSIIGMIFVGQLAGLLLYVLVRMVTLWFLVGVSPIAIVLSATPKTEKAFNEWLNHFITNLINLPILAFASYFVLNIMISVANTIMINPPEPGELLMATIGVVILLIILAQSLLMVAQKLNVTQVTMATSKISSWAKSGTKAAAKPVGKFLSKTAMQSKAAQSIASKLKNNKFASVASVGNKMSSKTDAIQKGNAADLKGLFDNGNWRALERQAKNRDPYIAAQALDYLAALDQVGDYEAAEGKKLTEDEAVVNRIFGTSQNNSAFKESGVFKSLKKKLPHFGEGINYATGDEEKDKKYKFNPESAAQNLAALLADPEKRKNVNMKSTLDVMFKAAGDKLPELMISLQKAITPSDMNAITSNLNPTAYASFMRTITKGIMIANDAKGKNWDKDKFKEALKNWDPSSRDTRNNLAPSAEQLTGDDYNWFAERYGGDKRKNVFADRARRWNFISNVNPYRNINFGPGGATPPGPVPPAPTPGTPPRTPPPTPGPVPPAPPTPPATPTPPTPGPVPPAPTPPTPVTPPPTPGPVPPAPTPPTPGPGSSAPSLDIDDLTVAFKDATLEIYSQLTDKISTINSSSVEHLQETKKILEKISASQKEIAKNILSNKSSYDEYLKQIASAQNHLASSEVPPSKDAEELKEILTNLKSTVQDFSKNVESLKVKKNPADETAPGGIEKPPPPVKPDSLL